jgi:hypothetical protein
LLVGSIVLLFPFWPLLRPAAWSAAFYPLICPKGRSTAAGLASHPWVLHHAVELHAGVAVFIAPWLFFGYRSRNRYGHFVTLTAEAVRVNTVPMAFTGLIRKDFVLAQPAAPEPLHRRTRS